MDDLFVLQSRLQEVQRQLVARDRVQAEETAALQTSRADDLRAQREVAVEQASSSELQSLREDGSKVAPAGYPVTAVLLLCTKPIELSPVLKELLEGGALPLGCVKEEITLHKAPAP